MRTRFLHGPVLRTPRTMARNPTSCSMQTAVTRAGVRSPPSQPQRTSNLLSDSSHQDSFERTAVRSTHLVGFLILTCAAQPTVALPEPDTGAISSCTHVSE